MRTQQMVTDKDSAGVLLVAAIGRSVGATSEIVGQDLRGSQ